MRTDAPILTTHDLAIGYRNGKVLSTVMQQLNLQLHGGKLTALIGQNGIGKSTLLRTIAGSQAAIDGTVNIGGRCIDELSQKELSRTMSLVYTDRTLAGGLTVSQLVSLGRYPHTGFFGRLDKHDRSVVDQAMAATGISHKSSSFVAELSDGERQKAMIARALAQETPVILLDEPTSFLDVASRIEVTTLLHSLAHNQGKAVLLSTHDISQALLLADDLWIVSRDRHISCGCTEDLIINGAMQHIFAPESGSKVTFNVAAGDFEVPMLTKCGYNLVCEDPTLRHWLANALRRNGIAPTGSDGTITAHTATSITVTTAAGTTHCHTIAALIAAITH